MKRVLPPANENIMICDRVETLMCKLEDELSRFANGHYAAVIYPAGYDKGVSLLRHIGAYRD